MKGTTFLAAVLMSVLVLKSSTLLAQGMCGGMGGWGQWGHEQSMMGGQFGIPHTQSSDFPDSQSQGAVRHCRSFY